MGFGGHISVSGGSDLLLNGLIIVDAVNGDDGTGERNNLSKPFATIAAAYAVYQEGDVIRVMPGAHTIVSQLVVTGFNNLVFDILPGAVITGSLNSTLISSIDATMDIHVFGYGEFRNNDVTMGGSPSMFSGRMIIHGAKKISVASGTLFNDTSGNSWLRLENIDEMYSQTSYSILWGNNPEHDGILYGVIRNCKKIGDNGFVNLAMSVASTTTTKKLYVENCTFYTGGNYTVFASNINNRCKFVNCKFDRADGNLRNVYVTGAIEFDNCHFQSNGSVETVWVNDVGDDNDPKPIFRDCSIRNDGAGVAVATRGPAQWHGTNRLYGNQVASGAITGYLGAENRNDGVIVVNKTMPTIGAQIFRFTPGTTPPTAGDQYIITEPGGDTISYTVVGGDTIDNIVQGLESAWQAKITAVVAPWKDWTPVAQLLPTGKLQATANDQIYNMDPDNAFVPSVIGTDVFTRDNTTVAAFAIVGPGKFIVDENLITPIVE